MLGTAAGCTQGPKPQALQIDFGPSGFKTDVTRLKGCREGTSSEPVSALCRLSTEEQSFEGCTARTGHLQAHCPLNAS